MRISGHFQKAILPFSHFLHLRLENFGSQFSKMAVSLAVSFLKMAVSFGSQFF
jgi:hypothetical protein